MDLPVFSPAERAGGTERPDDREGFVLSNGFVLQLAESGLTMVPRKPPGATTYKNILEHVTGPFPDPDLWQIEQPPGQPGSYYIVNVGIALVIGIVAQVTAGAALELFERKRETSQLWRFEAVPNEPGRYYIASAAMGLVMGAKAPVAAGAGALALERRPTANQWFKVLTATGAPAEPPAADPGR